MKTEKEIREEIEKVKKDYHDVLFVGSLATVEINAPRALMQLKGETVLDVLYWVLEENYDHKYPKSGINT